MASGWPKPDYTLAHTKRGFVLLDGSGAPTRSMDVLPRNNIIMDTDAVFYEGDGVVYLTGLLKHKSSTPFSTFLILDPALNVVYREITPKLWGMAMYPDRNGSPKILLPSSTQTVFAVLLN